MAEWAATYVPPQKNAASCGVLEAEEGDEGSKYAGYVDDEMTPENAASCGGGSRIMREGGPHHAAGVAASCGPNPNRTLIEPKANHIVDDGSGAFRAGAHPMRGAARAAKSASKGWPTWSMWVDSGTAEFGELSRRLSGLGISTDWMAPLARSVEGAEVLAAGYRVPRIRDGEDMTPQEYKAWGYELEELRKLALTRKHHENR
jgi:hypothetical protein